MYKYCGVMTEMCREYHRTMMSTLFLSLTVLACNESEIISSNVNACNTGVILNSSLRLRYFWMIIYIYCFTNLGKNLGFDIFAERFGKEKLEKHLKDELTVGLAFTEDLLEILNE